MKKEIRQNLIIYVIFLIIAITGLFYGRSINDGSGLYRVWNFIDILLLLIGVPFLFFQNKAKLPDFWDKKVRQSNRIIYPVLVGILFGVLDVAIFKLILHPEAYDKMPPFLQPFPYSVFLYVSGAFDVEIFYRLIPLTIILVIGNWFRKGKYYNAFFWTGAVLTALREPLEQLPEGSTWIIIYSLLTGFLMNFSQAVFYKRAGFMASISVRLGHYLLWHILLGMYVEFFELVG